MDDLEKSVIDSLDGQDAALLPFIPYLLQDFWELGSSGADILAMLGKHGLDHPPGKRALDLGCGKGAVAIMLAASRGFRVTGIDGLPGFIEIARKRAGEIGVDRLCSLRVGDIRSGLAGEEGYDLVLLNGVGPIWGSYRETGLALKRCLGPGGRIVLEDAFVGDWHVEESGRYIAYSDIIKQFQAAGLSLVDEQVLEPGEIGATWDEALDSIRRRAEESKRLHPECSDLFDAYVASQERETRVLREQVKCVLWLLRPEDGVSPSSNG